MTAYFLASPEELLDLDGLREYADHAPAIVEAFGGKYLIRNGKTEALEGAWDPGFAALIEFPSREALMNFFESPEYKPWRALRERSAKSSIVLIDEAPRG
jgi:uncharacterized protein (DUF1330 family)